jgi:integrase
MGVYKKGENWFIDYRVQGVRKRKKIGPSYQVAKLALKDVQVKIAQGKIGIEEPKKVPFREFALEYAEYCKVNKAKNTYKRDSYTIKAHLIPFFGSRFLHTITVKEIERYKAERLGKVKPETLNRELNTLKHLFRMAVEWGYTKENPAKSVKKVRVAETSPRFLDKEEVPRLLDACLEHTPEIYPLVVTGLHTGMRIGELLNLRWEDIDFGRETLTVSSREEWHTKNYESRTMALREEIRRVLEPTKEAKGLVFRPDGAKERNLYHYLSKKLDRAAKAAGLADVTWHTLRHTFASHLVMSGVDLPSVQKLMGHRDIKTTMKYAHLAPDHLRAAIAMLDFGGHFMDTKSQRSKISLNQNRRKSLGDANLKGKK